MSENVKRILHLEDNRAIQDYIGAILSDIAEITRAGTLKEARALIKETRFDLVLVDFTLPDGSGFDLVLELAKQDPTIPVVVFSSHDISDTTMNVSKVFVKGNFIPQELFNTVKSLINSAAK